MQTTFIILILLLGFLITFQIAKASEYVSVMRGEEKSRKQTNNDQCIFITGVSCTWLDWSLLLQ